MDFREVLRSGCCCASLAGRSKEEIIVEMIDLLVAGGKIHAGDRDQILAVIMDREKRMSTGIQHGVAMPHGKTELVEDLVTCVGVKPEGVDFGALDGKPSRIFVLVIASSLMPGPYMEYLSQISKVLGSAKVRDELLLAGTPDAILSILCA